VVGVRGGAHLPGHQVALLVAHLLAHAVRHFGALLLMLGSALFVIFALVAVRGVTLGLGLVRALAVVDCPALVRVGRLKQDRVVDKLFFKNFIYSYWDTNTVFL
jgi:hypothetical protein